MFIAASEATRSTTALDATMAATAASASWRPLDLAARFERLAPVPINVVAFRCVNAERPTRPDLDVLVETTARIGDELAAGG